MISVRRYARGERVAAQHAYKHNQGRRGRPLSVAPQDVPGTTPRGGVRRRFSPFRRPGGSTPCRSCAILIGHARLLHRACRGRACLCTMLHHADCHLPLIGIAPAQTTGGKLSVTKGGGDISAKRRYSIAWRCSDAHSPCVCLYVGAAHHGTAGHCLAREGVA